MGGFIELVIAMWVIAIVSFAPLAYFIYIFSKGDDQSFGKSDPAAHKFEESKYYDLINNTLQTILGGTGKPGSGDTGASPQSVSDSAATDRSTEETEQAKPDTVVGKGYGSIPVE